MLAGLQTAQAMSLEQAATGDHRSEANKARNEYRHPVETLKFFGIEPDMTVVEISPGGGWYTEILAPYLREQGQLIAAGYDPGSDVEYFRKNAARFVDKLAANPDVFDKVKVTIFQLPDRVDIAEDGSADMVLTFRNVHNWYMRGGGEENLARAFNAFFEVLKPGGVLGVVDHRLPADKPARDQEASGYMHEEVVIKAAEKAGFKLAASSDINANPKDTADHPKGVWTLPPSLALKEENKDKYQAIGESDRMTLKFVKP
ncbi:class I SAM-dependent methyltransferase [Bowmanella dokdonensis]